jgi:hypothetical protein
MAVALLPGPALAQFSGTAGWLSDKVAYGLSQSNGRPSAVLDLTLRAADGWAFSSGLATLGGQGRGEAEWTLGAGRGGMLGEAAAWQASYTRTETLGPTRPARPGFGQLALALAWGERFQLTALRSNGLGGADVLGGATRGHATFLEAAWHQPLGHRLAVDFGLGHAAYGGGLALAPYAYGSVGVSGGLGPVQFFLSRVESGSRSPNAARRRALVAVLWNF